MSLSRRYSYKTHLSHTSHYDTYLAYFKEKPEYHVVIKLFYAKSVLSTVTYEDFQRTEQRLLSLKHPSIVAILELGKEHDRPYLVSEYQSGISLQEHLDRIAPQLMPLDDALAIVMQIGQAIAFAHTRGIVHQDIRPENILLNEQGHAFLTNFFPGDIIRKPKDQHDGRALSYISPEQTVSPASDQYALGCLLYELITGKSFVSSSQHKPVLPTVPQALEAIIARALSPKAEERYPGVDAFLSELLHLNENANATVIHPALAAHAHMAFLDTFSYEERAENAALESLITEPESHISARQEEQREGQLFLRTAQKVPASPQIEPQRAATGGGLLTRKWLTGGMGAVVTLLLVALLLAYVFNAEVLPQLKQTSSLAVSPLQSTRTLISSTPVSSTPVPGTTTSTGGQIHTIQTPGVQTPAGQKPTVPASPDPTTSATPGQPVPTATQPTLGSGSIRIDSGGSGDGSFVADEYFTNTTPGRPSRAGADTSNVIDTSGVSNPAPESIYQSYRVGDCLYTIPHLTPGTAYIVRLHFAEIYWTQAGKRLFDVTLNGQLILQNFDIFASAGGANKAVVEQFTTSADSTGTITIQFHTVKNNALINAIEVLAG